MDKIGTVTIVKETNNSNIDIKVKYIVTAGEIFDVPLTNGWTGTLTGNKIGRSVTLALNVESSTPTLTRIATLPPELFPMEEIVREVTPVMSTESCTLTIQPDGSVIINNSVGEGVIRFNAVVVQYLTESLS